MRITLEKIEEAKQKYLAAKNITTYQKKKKGGQDWFPLWLDYLQMREAFKEQTKDDIRKKYNLLVFKS